MHQWGLYLERCVRWGIPTGRFRTLVDELGGERRDHHSVVRAQREARDPEFDAVGVAPFLRKFPQPRVCSHSPAQQQRARTSIFAGHDGFCGEHINDGFLE